MPKHDWSSVLGALPLCSPEELIGERDVLVIAPHPDDESLGCGGLLAWAAATGRRPRVLFLTDGEASHPGSLLFPPKRLARHRRREAVEACAALGLDADALTFLGYADSGLDSLSAEESIELVQTMRAWIQQSARSAVCVTAHSDPHSDHVAAFRWVRYALRGSPTARLFAYPVWTWMREDTERNGLDGRRVCLGDFRARKRAAILAYASQHGKVVSDAIESFVLPDALLNHVQQDYEVLFDVPL